MSRKFGWHSGVVHAQDAKIRGDLYVQDDIVFSDVSAGVLGVTGGIDMTGTTSAIGINFTGGAFATGAIMAGTGTGAPQTMAAAEDFILGIYTTCADTDGANTARPLYVNAAYTGAGQVARAAEFVLRPTAQLGGWVTGIKSYVDFATTAAAGGAAGLISSVCAEMRLPNGACTGHFFPIEVEWVGQASTSFSTVGTGAGSGFLWLKANGTVTDFDSDGVFMSVQGLTAGSGKLLAEDSHTLRCDLGYGTLKYLLLSDAADSISLAYTASIAEVIAITVTTGDTVTTGMSMSGAGTYTTGILLDATALGKGLSISGGVSDTGIEIGGTCTNFAIDISGAQTAAGISVAGTCGSDGIVISGACTTSALHISGDQAIAVLVDVDASATDGLKMSVDDSMTLTKGIHILQTGTTGIITTGIDLASGCVTGIDIGACTTGIVFSGINTKNITMGTTGGSGTTTALGTLGASWYGIEISVSANCAGFEAHAVRAEIETTTGTAGNIMCGRFDAVATHSVNTLNGINATAQMNDDMTIGGRVAAGYISLYGAASKTLTRTANSIYALFVQHLLYSDPGDAANPAGAGGVADFYNAAVGISMPSGTYCDYGIVVKGETNGTIAAILLGPHGTTTWENGIRFSNGSPGDAGSSVSGGITNAIYFDSQCPVVDLIKWEATGYATGCVDTSDSITTQSGASTGAIKVDVAGSKYYIPIFAEGSQGAGA